jgi:hypothetical protein
MEIRVLGASGQLGYGMPEPAFRAGLARRPHVIGADLGSSDPGPHALGSGRDPRGPAVVRRDLELLLAGGLAAGVPVLMGSAGIAGGRPHLEGVAGLVRGLAARHGWRFRMAVIDAEVEPSWVVGQLAAGLVRPLGSAPPLTAADVAASTRIVAQMGAEPFVEALEAGADVVVAGRACDTAIFAAHPLLHGAAAADAYHMAKIVECASQCADPGGRDAILATLDGDGFLVESMAPQRRCTPVGVAAHALYEEADPFRFAEPSGAVDTTVTRYQAASERTTRVSGSRWVPAATPTLKLEGAAPVGFRTVCLGGVRDPRLLAALPEVTAAVADRVAEVLDGTVAPSAYQLGFRVYGRDAVLGPAEPERTPGHEVGVLIDVVAETQEIAHDVCATARQHLLHAAYPGSLGAAGNLALPFSPSELDAGPVHRFSVHHLVEVADPGAPFEVVLEEVGR